MGNQGFRAAGIQGFRDLRTQGFKELGNWVLRDLEIKRYGIRDLWFQGSRNQWIKSFRFGDLVIDGIQGFRDLEIYRFRDLEFGDLGM